VISLDKDNFDEVVLKATTPVIVEFWAAWCGPCRSFEPKLRKIAKKYGNKIVVAKVNVDEQPKLANRFQITGIPHTIFLAGGEKRSEILGDTKMDRLEKAVVDHLKTYGPLEESDLVEEEPKQGPIKSVVSRLRKLSKRSNGD